MNPLDAAFVLLDMCYRSLSCTSTGASWAHVPIEGPAIHPYCITADRSWHMFLSRVSCCLQLLSLTSRITTLLWHVLPHALRCHNMFADFAAWLLLSHVNGAMNPSAALALCRNPEKGAWPSSVARRGTSIGQCVSHVLQTTIHTLLGIVGSVEQT